MNCFSLSGLAALFLCGHAYAAFSTTPLPPQNVVFISFDGVRYKDVFKPEPADFLKGKSGYPLAKTLTWLRKNKGFVFGTQDPGDEMEVSNTSCKSLPGYKAIFSGINESTCADNYDCAAPKTETIIDYLMNLFKQKKQIALFSSWNQIALATEGIYGKRVVQSLGLAPLQNFSIENEVDRSFYLRYQANYNKSHSNLPSWERARKDEYTWRLATDYLKTYHPRFIYISLLDTDEWAHAGNRQNYFQSLNQYDEWVSQLLKELSSTDAGREYLQNTSFVMTTDHGRGGDSWNFDYHGSHYGVFMNGSENIWSFIAPSAALQKHYHLTRSSHGASTRYKQIDIRPTLERLLQVKRMTAPDRGNPLLVFGNRKNTIQVIKDKINKLL